MRNTKKQVGHKTAKNIMSAVLTALMAMSSAGSVTAVNLASVSAKTTVKKAAKKSTKKTVKKSTARTKKKTPKVYITPTSKTIYTKSSTYVYLKNNKSKVSWTASNSKISLSKKTKGSVKVYGKSAGTSYVTAKVGKTKYTAKVVVKTKKASVKNTVNAKLSCTSTDLIINHSFVLKISGTNGQKVTWSTDWGDTLKLSNKTNTSVTVTGISTSTDYVKATVGGKTYLCKVHVRYRNSSDGEKKEENIPAWTSKEGLDAVNNARAKCGLAAYKTDPLLDKFAIQRIDRVADYYFKNGHLSHDYYDDDDLTYDQSTQFEKVHPEIDCIREDLGVIHYNSEQSKQDIADSMIQAYLADNHKKDLLCHTYTYASVATKIINGKQFFVVLVSGPYPSAKDFENDTFWG